MKKRLDQTLVALGLADSRARAQAMIAAGAVRVGGAVAAKAAMKVTESAVAVTADPLPWVSRGALKLAHALDHFDLSPEGAVAADIGASTGGFTEVLLARGAARVVAVDVGHGQMHPRLAGDPRVENREGVNARHLAPDALPSLDAVVSDVSFISATKALPPALDAARRGAWLVTLVKPQFELEPGDIGKGGIVRDPDLHDRAVARIRKRVATAGWRVAGVTPSPIRGGDGNTEFLLAARKD